MVKVMNLPLYLEIKGQLFTLAWGVPLTLASLFGDLSPHCLPFPINALDTLVSFLFLELTKLFSAKGAFVLAVCSA